jgi:UDP-3-O-[3-hydroxymyristoyl] N-acetylglucosamine deacetylase
MLGQRTLRNSISASGVGLHSGSQIAMKLHPAPPGTGIVFRRTDLAVPVYIPAPCR